MTRRKRTQSDNVGAEASGIGLGGLIAGASQFVPPDHPTLKSFLVFIAPFVAILTNKLVKSTYDGWKRKRDFERLLQGVDQQITDPQTSPVRKAKLLKLREDLLEARLQEQIEQIELPV